MADNEQQMVLVAKLVDQVSDKLKQINKQMLATEGAAKKAHAEGSKAADVHRKSIEALKGAFEKLKDTSTDVIKPGMAALGVEALSVAGAIGLVVEAVKSLGEQGAALEKTSHRSGMLAGQIRELQVMGARWGVSLDQTNESLSEFGEFMDKTSRRAPDAMRAWMQMPGLWQALGSELEKFHGKHKHFDQAEAVLDFLPRLKYGDQKRQVLAMMGLPQDWANYADDTLAEMRGYVKQFDKEHPLDVKKAEALDFAFFKIGMTINALKTDLSQAFAGPVQNALNQLDGWLRNPQNVEKMQAAFKDLATDIVGFAKGANEAAQALGGWKRVGEAFIAVKLSSELLSIASSLRLIAGIAMPEWFLALAAIAPAAVALDAYAKNSRLPKNAKPSEIAGGDGDMAWASQWAEAKAKAAQSPNDRVAGAFAALQPSSSDVKRNVQEPVYRGTLDALRDTFEQWFGPSRASASTGGGGGGASPYFSNLYRGERHPVSGTNEPLSPVPQRQRNNFGIPASIRYNNPGAAWPSSEARRFGMTDWGVIGGANKIAGFPDPVQGAAANMALLADHYVGMPIGAAVAKWTAGGRHGLPGYNPNQILTREMVNDPAFMSAWMRETATAEAGRKRGIISNEQIAEAFKMYQAGSVEAYRRQQHPAVGARRTDGQLLKQGGQWAFAGKPVEGNAKISVDFSNIPRGAKTAATYDGLFKQMKVNRGFAMPLASDSD